MSFTTMEALFLPLVSGFAFGERLMRLSSLGDLINELRFFLSLTAYNILVKVFRNIISKFLLNIMKNLF